MPAAAAGTSRDGEFAELARTIRAAGLMRRRHAYYAVNEIFTVALFVGAWVAFALLGDSWWQLVTAAVLAVAGAQLAFVGHEAGHKQIFRSRGANDAVGYVHAGLVGLSYGWWVAKHNRHHTDPNHETDDPDLDIAVLAFTTGQGTEARGVARWIIPRQAYLFFPLLLLEGIMLHWASLDAAWRGDIPRRGLERALILGHIAVYLAAVFVVLPVPMALVFIAVHQGLWGLYMGLSFAPNHKGMETVAPGQRLGFLRKQVLTSRDVSGGYWVDVALGGLNYQIEHHLFPSMPRANLRHAQPLVQAFCVENGISYSRCGLVESYTEVLRHLHAMGAPLREAQRG